MNFNPKLTQYKILTQQAKHLNRHLAKDTDTANKHMKRCPTSYVFREMQAKTMRYHHVLIRMAQIQSTDNTRYWQECGACGTLIHC